MLQNKIWNTLDFVKWNTQYFIKHKICSPKLESELILCKLFKCKRIDLYTQCYNTINSQQLKVIENYINRRISGEPIQYILESALFYGRDFFVNKNVLIPRFDSEVIIDIIKKKSPINNLLEIGTGSGNLSITIAIENIANNIIATDISKEILEVARKNKKRLCPKLNINFILDNFLTTNINKKFDVIISNPPYIPKNEIKKLDDLVKDNEPLNALTDEKDGFTFYKQFALQGKKILKNNGFILLEIGINNTKKKLKSIFKDYQIEFFNDLNGIPRVIQIY